MSSAPLGRVLSGGFFCALPEAPKRYWAFSRPDNILMGDCSGLSGPLHPHDLCATIIAIGWGRPINSKLSATGSIGC